MKSKCVCIKNYYLRSTANAPHFEKGQIYEFTDQQFVKREYPKGFNVSFSKGSILKSIYDKCITGGTFGIPSNVKRHFITHNEAASLCFKSVLKECENSIILPNPDKIGDAKSILVLCKKILKKFNINFKRKSSGYYSKGLKVKFVKALTVIFFLT